MMRVIGCALVLVVLLVAWFSPMFRTNIGDGTAERTKAYVDYSSRLLANRYDEAVSVSIASSHYSEGDRYFVFSMADALDSLIQRIDMCIPGNGGDANGQLIGLGMTVAQDVFVIALLVWLIVVSIKAIKDFCAALVCLRSGAAMKKAPLFEKMRTTSIVGGVLLILSIVYGKINLVSRIDIPYDPYKYYYRFIAKDNFFTWISGVSGYIVLFVLLCVAWGVIRWLMKPIEKQK